MIARKGWLISKVHIPNKPGRYGIKVYLVSVSMSDYICNMEVYTGKSQPVKIWVYRFRVHSYTVKDTRRVEFVQHLNEE